MAAENPALYTFNRGLVSNLALARVDLKRVALSAEVSTNWMPRKLGSMMLRPGWEYIDGILGNVKPLHIPHVFAFDDCSLVEVTPNNLRIRINDVILTRPAVTAPVTNGNFTTDLTGWTSADQPGAVSAWETGGGLSLIGTGVNFATRYQAVATSSPNVEHALRLVIARGNVTLMIGASQGDDVYFESAILAPGTHSISFTPTASPFYIQLQASQQWNAIVQSCNVEGAGTVILPAPWQATDLPNIRWDQSGDTLFIACDGYQQRRIERRGARPAARSWSIVFYQTIDGPFLNRNVTPTTLTASASSGDITLTSSEPIFYPGHVGALFRLQFSNSQVNAELGGVLQFTDPIESVGQLITVVISGTWAGTLTTEFSAASPGSWTQTVPTGTSGGTTWTANGTYTFAVGETNEVYWLRIGFETGEYTSGTAVIEMSASGNISAGVVMITGYTNSKTASAAVVSSVDPTGTVLIFNYAQLGAIIPTSIWWEGSWSNVQGWPTAVCIYEDRMGWFGRGNAICSITDAYESFNDFQTGDNGVLNATIGSGPVDVINWSKGTQRLLLGAAEAEIEVRSSYLGEPLTPTDFIIKPQSTQGSTTVDAVKVDNDLFFVQRGTARIFKFSYQYSFSMIDYTAADATALVPDLGIPAAGGAPYVLLRVQRQPDTRIHALRSDGAVAVMISDTAEDVQCWTLVETAGVVEDIVILPGLIEDIVYYSVARQIGGTTVRTLEKWAREDECWGATISKIADCHTVFNNGSPTNVIDVGVMFSGLEFVCWADGIDQGGPFTVDGSGNITLPAAVTAGVVGLGYTAQWQSAKLAYASPQNTGLSRRKRISGVAIIATNLHPQGLEFGPDFEHLDNLPLIEDGTAVSPNAVWTEYDKDPIEFPGEWNTDSRICLQAKAPRPVTVLAAVLDMQAS